MTNQATLVAQRLDAWEGDSSIVENNLLWGTNANAYVIDILAGSTGYSVVNNLIFHANLSLYVRNNGSGTVSGSINRNPILVDAAGRDLLLDGGTAGNGSVSVLWGETNPSRTLPAMRSRGPRPIR